FTGEELETYDKYWDSIRSEKTLVNGAKEEGEIIGVEKGKAEGEIIGVEKGKIEGEIIGVEKGKAEGEKIGIYKTILESLRNGLDKELISKITNVSVETIEKINRLLEKYDDKAEEHFDEY
ncbi:MAG: hypothetical protein U9R42_10990, partial [Bacteroidota bacterium]|nr:hypothetical protein [Bacteroidota bacterium]